ncbi:Signal recognition particle subunit Srp21 [Schizosaccharomyces pombe]|uniref:Uncharacterized protein C17H9.07 n=1 Tax=Schizosaccharomyces pombe (strain 972 / ATCC 24843) TaxID=284812 RepID=YE07_SCHPO|nr:putative signal recognition particle subunit Srp21 [Schizosaccharomyces pombe]O13804.1 RecName: Full=Uncharacterized protein C17H9.07 [Schizosaccharomyces pombe 972h-]CAB11216.1 signal recognition particle subunit Srp21 (predicted) [Schizosaccharomyces pombe]|eukprot:NP_001342841.1 putative signal recognition particle subunit Srp21 [Schizosaccharomyces pombe]
MVYLQTVNEFFTQSKSLTEAYPKTTKLSIKYRTNEQSQNYLIAKAFESASGICLKYRTDKAAELGRLLLIANKLSYVSTGNEIPPEPEQEVVASPVTEQKKAEPSAPPKGSKKKKRGKKK